MKEGDIVRIEWWDAESSDSGWTAMDELKEWAKKPFPTVESIGRVLFSGPQWVVLLASQSVSPDDDDVEGYHGMKIPRLWIKSIHILEQANEQTE